MQLKQQYRLEPHESVLINVIHSLPLDQSSMDLVNKVQSQWFDREDVIRIKLLLSSQSGSLILQARRFFDRNFVGV